MEVFFGLDAVQRDIQVYRFAADGNPVVEALLVVERVRVVAVVACPGNKIDAVGEIFGVVVLLECAGYFLEQLLVEDLTLSHSMVMKP